LRKFEQAVEHYATTLELLFVPFPLFPLFALMPTIFCSDVRSKTHAEDAPEMADVYFAYGKALLENAISQNSVLGKEQQQQEEGGAEAEGESRAAAAAAATVWLMKARWDARVESALNGSKILSFSGDAEEEEEDPAVDLFAEVSKPDAEGGEEAADGEGADDAEPEDDFNAAWEVLDLARAIYEKQMDTNDEMKLKVADTFITLEDISLETGACSSPPSPLALFPQRLCRVLC
jgi:HAT1-interacting factor 1